MNSEFVIASVAKQSPLTTLEIAPLITQNLIGPGLNGSTQITEAKIWENPYDPFDPCSILRNRIWATVVGRTAEGAEKREDADMFSVWLAK